MKEPSNVGIGLSFDTGIAEGFASIDSLSNLLFSLASLFGNIPANAYKVSTTSSSSFVIGPVTVFLGNLSEPHCFYKKKKNPSILKFKFQIKKAKRKEFFNSAKIERTNHAQLGFLCSILYE